MITLININSISEILNSCCVIGLRLLLPNHLAGLKWFAISFKSFVFISHELQTHNFCIFLFNETILLALFINIHYFTRFHFYFPEFTKKTHIVLLLFWLFIQGFYIIVKSFKVYTFSTNTQVLPSGQQRTPKLFCFSAFPPKDFSLK